MSDRITEIAEEIKTLVDELVSHSGGKAVSKKTKKELKKKEIVKTKGASGALNILMNGGFFDRPQELGAVLGKMREIGRYYSKASIGMNLLSLTQRRILSRFKEKGEKNWKYVLSK